MTRTRPFQNAFSSGEIDPLLHDRVDFQRHQTGLAKCRGYIPLRQGGFTRAPGTIYRGTTRNNMFARRVPFEFAADDALSLEFTHETMRVWRYGDLVMDGGVPYELAVPFRAQDLKNLSWVQDKDVIYLADGAHPIQKLSRFALDSWTIAAADLELGPFRVQNLDAGKTVQASAATGSITLTGTGDIFSADWIGSLIRIEPTDIKQIPNWVGNAASAVDDLVIYDGRIYRQTAGTTTGVEPPVHRQGEVLSDASGTTRYLFVSDLVGVVRVSGFTDANTVTADVIKTIPSPCVDDPTYRWSEGAWSERQGYPRCLEMFDQRLWAARTTAEPRTVWASTAGAFLDFSPSAEADGSFAYTIAATQTQNAIEWLFRARKNGIYIGSIGDVTRGFSNTSGQIIGPTTFDTETVSTDGASEARPIAGQGWPIHITRGGRRVQELRYSLEEDGAKPVELSLPSQHLGALEFKQMVWQSEPQRFAWVRVANGTLVVMSYDPAQDVLGWARVPLAGGFVEDMDITSGLEGGTDVVTLTVRRMINGQTVRFVEEQALIYGVLTGGEPIEKAVHSFAAIIYDDENDPRHLFDLPHLVGEAVSAWTDKGEFGPYTVPADGQIELEKAVTHAVIGLVDDTHFAESLDVEAVTQEGNSRGRLRRLHSKQGISVYKTAAGYVAPVERHFGREDVVGHRHEILPLGVAADLTEAVSGITKIPLQTGHADAVRLRYFPHGGAPMTITGHTPNIEEAGP